MVYLASQQQPRADNLRVTQYDASIVNALAAYVDRFSPRHPAAGGGLRTSLEPVVPDVIADAVREVAGLAGEAAERVEDD